MPASVLAIGRLRNFRIVSRGSRQYETRHEQTAIAGAANVTADPRHLEEVRATIAAYLRAVKANDTGTLRSIFDPKANVAHYHVKNDAVVTNTLDEFMGVIQSLHAKFDNAEEIGEAMNVRLVGHLQRVPIIVVHSPNV